VPEEGGDVGARVVQSVISLHLERSPHSSYCHLRIAVVQVAAEPPEGCTPTSYTGRIKDMVVVVRRGGCGFGDKVKAAQALGALAVIVANSDDSIQRMMAADAEKPQMKIPAVMISATAGETVFHASSGGGRNGAGGALAEIIGRFEKTTYITNNG